MHKYSAYLWSVIQNSHTCQEESTDNTGFVKQKWITITGKMKRSPDVRAQRKLRCFDIHRGLCQSEEGECT